jgi:uncharacterized coiled-coil protein SlyX
MENVEEQLAAARPRCANQRRELRRLNAKIRSLVVFTRLDEAVGEGRQSAAEMWHELEKLRERLGKGGGDA